MPKTIKGHRKSGRKALSNISNCNHPPNQNRTVSKQAEANNNGGDDADDNCAIDRLHAAHKNLSQLIEQIGLVIHAHKPNPAHKLGEPDIECFIGELLATHSKLQGWLPKFEQAFSCHSDISEKQPLPLSPVVSSSAINDENLFTLNNSRNSLSPSPLVSWPLGITTDCGRELFALTPLPKLRTSTDFKGFFTAAPTACGDKGELASVLKTPVPFQHLNKLQEKVEAVTSQKLEAVIPEQVDVVTPQISKCHTLKSTQMFRGSSLQCLKEDTSKMFATPGLEISPPKTCLLMRPISKPLQLQNDVSVESTPPVTVNFRKFDESLSSDDSPIPKSLRIKYPDLFKKVADDCPPMKTPVQMSPHLGMSPPKTCVLMVPSTDALSDDQDIFDSDKSFERDKYSCSSEVPHNLSVSVDCGEAGKSGGYTDKTNPDAKVLMTNYPNSLCQALAFPTFSSKMEQTEEVAKKSQEPCETMSSTGAGHEEKKVSSYMCRSLDNSDPVHPRLSMAEGTPIFKINFSNVQNTEQRAKQPGEQTLRRELWSKLKAASADAYPKANKDFLSNLQETSIEDNSRTNVTSHICSLAKSSLSSKNEAIPEKRSIDLAKSAARISVKQSAQRSYTRDMLQKAGDVSILDPMKRTQMIKPSKTDSTIMRTSRFQRKVKQADETSYTTRFHAP
ncbi:hypothetical protein SUGI_0604720 [Cryptomeria japonica]|uniref:uncharacterized protein LOC131076985 n=1 Tax=Cryptomeria japonica TaxID=3369 RepID=UPI0024147BAE|nr:uncharacterized protein LOC131076985 [Cryptomeria japonica]GLJ30543.1 hypothetical protein SUGI_0604720 [Cryptomeria japonica]